MRRGAPQPGREADIMGLWTQIALEERTRPALDQALYELGRAGTRSPLIAGMEDMLKSALLHLSGDMGRARVTLDTVARFADPALEVWRHAMSIQLAAACGAEREAELVEEVLPWARGQAAPEVEARVLGWLGRVRYGQGRFAEAARLQEQAALCAQSVMLRLSSRLNGASAWMETGAYANARALAAAALKEAEQHRHGHFAGRAEWLLRAVGYRAGDALAPDLELVAAAGALDVPYLQGLIGLTEAALAWRCGDRRAAGEVAAGARACFAAADLIAGRVLARALELHCTSGPQSALDELARRVLAAPIPDVDWQVLGLLSRSPGGGAWKRDAGRLARAAGDPDRCRELLAPRQVFAPDKP
jgi:hypothetical protein